MKLILFTLLLTICTGVAATALAQSPMVYEPTVKIPGLDPNTSSTQEYINALYMLAIMVGALIAVIKIIFAGVKWMFSDSFTDKGSAKKDIKGALLGLLIILAAVVILNTINPNLTKLKFLEDAPPIGGLGNGNQWGIDQRSHDEINEQIRSENPNVISTFTGTPGTQEYMTNIRSCRDKGGWPSASSEGGGTFKVECRTK